MNSHFSVRTVRTLFVSSLLALLSACGGLNLEDQHDYTATISGAVTGLAAGTSVVLHIYNRGGYRELAVSQNGDFSFNVLGYVDSNNMDNGADYNVTVLTQPAAPAHPCTVVDGDGAARESTPYNTSPIQVVCAAAVSTAFVQIDMWGNYNGCSCYSPTDVALDSAGIAYVVNNADSGISVMDLQGWQQENLNGFSSPSGIAVNAAGNIYVADTGSNTIRSIDTARVTSTFAGSGVAGSANGPGIAASFNAPSDIAVDAAGNVYVADTGNNLIRMITPAGLVSTFAGSGATGSVNGAGTAASFSAPSGIAVDTAGNVYVADTGNNLIRMITPAGVVSTLAGSGATGSVNGAGTAASFNAPSGLAINAVGNIYVADTGNNMIRMITPAGVVGTLAGSGSAGAANGPADVATFNGPRGINVDASGNVYVADTGNDLIRIVTP